MALHTERSLFCLCARSLSLPSFAANDVQGRRGERRGGGKTKGKRKQSLSITIMGTHTKKEEKKELEGKGRDTGRGEDNAGKDTHKAKQRRDTNDNTSPRKCSEGSRVIKAAP